VMAPTMRRPKSATVFFVARFNRPFATFGGWKDGKLVEVDHEIAGSATGAYVSFPTTENEQRLMKVGISYVSMEQARLNLDTELPHWDFDRITAESHDEWNRWLGRIRVEGGTYADLRRFYTDLWKAL